MRIAYLNVWGSDSAETHAGSALRKVGEKLGVEIVPCRNSTEAEACNPDFVCVLSRTQAKLTRADTYLAINEPASVYLREPGLIPAVLSFDGYLAVADTLKTFLRHALFGVGRTEEVGTYYNTAPRMSFDSAPVKEALFGGTAKFTYFGTHWDGRRQNFFNAIGGWPDAEIYGRKQAWERWNLPNYKGELVFDGTSVIEKYRQNGIGLNIQGDHHVQEDVISNRVFEITAAGAVCVTCRMPWLEKNYGDTLYYFEQETSDKRLAEQIRAILDHIRKNPEEAWKKAQAAREIFEEKFSLEVMLEKTLAFHKARQEKLAKVDRAKDPLITVILESSGKNPAGLARALQSIASQRRGRFQVLVEKPPEKAGKTPHLTVETFKGGLWGALKQAKGDYIALLNDAHEWFPQHIERLLDAAANGDKFVHAALVTDSKDVAAETAWIANNEKRRLTHQFDLHGKSFADALGMLNPFGFLAHASLLDARLMEYPQLEDGAREYLILNLLARAAPRQNFAATVLRHEAEFTPAAASPAAMTAFMLRLWRETNHTGAPNTFIEQLPETGFRMRARRFETLREERDGVIHDILQYPRFDRTRLQPIPLPWIKDQSFFHMGVNLIKENPIAVSVSTKETMRGLAGFIAFPQGEEGSIPIEYLLVVEAEVEKGQFGVQLLHNNRTLERYSVARNFGAGRKYRLEIPVYYRPEVSGLVIEVTPGTTGYIRSLTAYIEV